MLLANSIEAEYQHVPWCNQEEDHDEPIFVGLVVMTVVTILMAGPLMKYYLGREDKLAASKMAGLQPPGIEIIKQPEKTIAGI